jgi:oligopeptide transport system substrate-binding protein
LAALLALSVIGAASPRAATAAPSGKKVFTYAINYDPAGLNPQKNYAQRGQLVTMNLYEGIVRTDERMVPIPGVAERWTISKDGLVYTFYLRKNAKWQDGKSLNANDFYWSWLRAVSPKTESKFSNLMFCIKGAEGLSSGKSTVADFGVKVLDDYTIQVTLVGPLPYFLQQLAHGVYFPQRKDVVEANPDAWSEKPETSMTNGPFYLKEYSMNQKIVLAKNPNFWESAKIKVDEIQFVVIPDNGTALAAFKAGDIDAFDSLPTAEIPKLMMESDEIKVDPIVRAEYLAFNVNTAPFTDKRVRQALALAINKKDLAENVLKVGRKGATGYVPSGLWVEGEDFRKVGGDLGMPITGDIARAKKLLADAGFPDGKGWPEGLAITISSGFKTAAETVQEMWKKNLGIAVKVEVVENKVATERRNTKKFQMAMGGWSAETFHPIYFLNQVYSESNSNYPGYKSPEYDALIKQSLVEPDPKKVVAILHQAEQLAFGVDVPLIPLYYQTSPYMVKDGITGFMSDPIGKFLMWYVDVSGKK